MLLMWKLFHLIDMYFILFKDFKRATVPEQVIEKVLPKTILFFSFLMMITQRERTEKNIYIHIFLIFFGKILKKKMVPC